MENFLATCRKVSPLLLFLMLITTNVQAAVMICMGPRNNNCYVGEGSCDGWCPDPPKDPNCTNAMVVKNKPQPWNPETDYIVSTDGHASVVGPAQKVKIPLVSDKFADFLSNIKVKYAKTRNSEEGVQAKVQAEFRAFLRTDDGVVGRRRLEVLAKETGLKVRASEKQ